MAYIAVLGLLGVATGMLLYGLAGLMAFWARRTLPFQLVIQKFMFLLGGLFAPISLYPGWLRKIGEASPFAAHLYWAGAQSFAPSTTLFLKGLAWETGWMVVLALACAAVWRAGLSRVLARGGP